MHNNNKTEQKQQPQAHQTQSIVGNKNIKLTGWTVQAERRENQRQSGRGVEFTRASLIKVSDRQTSSHGSLVKK
jgi:hypothetical protein